ncbi:geminin-like [Branchiostoma lanceolatum]|uniref:GMNN protein n=1 Tax=Branchiostoma lanceolatum TaxID=7740 RepID=A0A8K0EK03_BRALA|nr:GMNN [Branchiostoma lanceolatum]
MASVVQNARLSAEISVNTALSYPKTIPRGSSSSSGSSDSEERSNTSAAMLGLGVQKTASPQQHKRRKVKSFKDRSKMSVASPKRRKLQTLQLTAKPGQLAGNNTILRFLDKKSTKRKSCSDGERNKPVKLPRSDLASRTATTTPVIYQDQDSSNDSSSCDDSKSLAQEALDIMKNEPTPESYWQDVAEERRLALVDTLKENEELHEQLEEKKAVIQEKEAVIQDLTEENETLKKMAEQAEDLLSILKPITEDEENPKSEDNTVDDASTSSSTSHTEEAGATSHQEGSDSS